MSETADNPMRLMAAAPDLLATLREIEEFLRDRADADYDGDKFRPNAEMRLLNEVYLVIRQATEG